ncbi:ABC transporter ATP-binding protein [Haladaptatus salinisoli]|uniref:ABC transporter ATP-binding protein n=1 Tax=Haladaptatus salinisoli TaxID=2884876 RepID=UPI001D0AD50A|nr:oligopeptide/dipeptide ABC transporter ATP-binding protein [Haladaptatus salinisoli]
MSADDSILEVRNLKKHYPVKGNFLQGEVGRVKAVDGISFEVSEGETVGLVGESGCGKSSAAESIIHLEEPTSGEILFDGKDVSEFTDREWKRFRRNAQMIFQDPDSSFDPRMSIGECVAEPLKIHGMRDRAKRRAIVEDLLMRVGLTREDADRYPHEFSGGQKQRIAIARALATNPKLIIADEPVSALDVSIQANVLSLLNRLQAEFGIAIVIISHNLGVVREVCDYVNVMYLGEIVESGPTDAVFERPQHPYTRALLSSMPTPDPRRRGQTVELTGEVPDPSNPPSGCRFHTRCPEIIQPDGYDFEQSNWRAVMNLRVQLQTKGIDLDAVHEFIEAEHDRPVAELDDSTSIVGNVIRDEFEIPESLSDSRADDVLDRALAHVANENQERARELLAKEFHTVCEDTHPELGETKSETVAACLLRDDSGTERDAIEAGD